jgi:hypothetical protein
MGKDHGSIKHRGKRDLSWAKRAKAKGLICKQKEWIIERILT